MSERELLLNTGAALLVCCLIWSHGGLARRMGVGVFPHCVLGILFPLLDFVVYRPTAPSRLDFLDHPAVFTAPFYAAVGFAALGWLALQILPFHRVLPMVLGWSGGFLLNLLISLLTPAGVPLLAPFHTMRISFPIFPVGHPPLLVILAAALLLAPWYTRRFSWSWHLITGLVVVYGLFGGLQFALVKAEATRTAPAESSVFVYPQGRWLAEWRVVIEKDSGYQVFSRQLFQDGLSSLGEYQRWNQPARMLRLLGDPVVRHMVYRVFRHPVADIQVTGSQLKMNIREAGQELVSTQAPMFSLEVNLNGQNRSYHLVNFH